MKFKTIGLKHWLIWFEEQDKTNDDEEMESCHKFEIFQDNALKAYYIKIKYGTK